MKELQEIKDKLMNYESKLDKYLRSKFTGVISSVHISKFSSSSISIFDITNIKTKLEIENNIIIENTLNLVQEEIDGLLVAIQEEVFLND